MATLSQTLRNTTEQARAKHAYESARAAQEANKLDRFNSLAKKLPMHIKSSGLGAALAFVKSKHNEVNKPENEHRLIYQKITEWLQSEPCPLRLPLNQDLTYFLVSQDSALYRAYAAEILAYLNWLRRFTEGLSSDQPNRSTT